MNLEIQNDIPEYIKNLPKTVQDVVLDGVWQDRTSEVAKKYSLNDKQTNDLINKTLFVLIGLDSADTFETSIVDELHISRLLSEQIVSELDARVFDYALNQVENKTKTKSATDFPDIAPKNLPMVEVGEVAHDVPRETVSVPKYVPTAFIPPTPPIQLTPKPQPYQPITQKSEVIIKPAPISPIEPVKIVPTPDFEPVQSTFVPKPDPTPAITPIIQTPVAPVITQKPVTETPSQTAQEKPPQKYAVDPIYRNRRQNYRSFYDKTICLSGWWGRIGFYFL
jgi:hypothetical protein